MLLKVTITPAGGVYNLAQKSEKQIVVSILEICIDKNQNCSIYFNTSIIQTIDLICYYFLNIQ